MPGPLARSITAALTIPTIGIGAGMETDGQILVWHDLLGLHSQINPRFVKRFAQGKDIFLAAINDYAKEVQQAQFPSSEHTF